MFGGTGVLPKISQDEKLDINTFQDRSNFKIGKTVTISYDISNISDNSKVLELDGILSRSNGAEFEEMSTMSQHVVLEPCTVFKTIEWRFTPGMTGSYLFEINDDSGTSYGLGFTVKESIESPLAQFKSGIPPEQVSCKDGLEIAIKKNNGHPLCLTSQTKEKLIQRGWAEPATIVEGEWINKSKG